MPPRDAQEKQSRTVTISGDKAKAAASKFLKMPKADLTKLGITKTEDVSTKPAPKVLKAAPKAGKSGAAATSTSLAGALLIAALIMQ